MLQSDNNRQITMEGKEEKEAAVSARNNSLLLLISKNKKLTIIGFSLVLLVIILGVVLFCSSLLFKPSLSTKSVPPAEPSNVLLASFNGKKIYRSDVKKIALEQYSGNAINSKIMKIALDIAIERAILESEAQRLEIKVKQTGDNIMYYQNLKDEVLIHEIGSVTANTISFWTPAFHDIYPQTPEDQEMRELQPKIFNEAIASLKKGKSTYEVGKEILEQYPVFKPRLAVNSYIFTKVTNVLLMQEPVVYEYNVNDSNKLFLDFVFATPVGQIKTLVWPDGEGAAIVQVVARNSGAKLSYNKWLEEKKKSVRLEGENISKI